MFWEILICARNPSGANAKPASAGSKPMKTQDRLALFEFFF
jgi:hypothetical protein